MTNMITKLRSAAQKRAQYNRTVTEIERLPLAIALDLNIFPGDAHRIAQKAVYGQ